MGAAAKIGRGAIRIANTLVNVSVLAAILLLLAFSGYAIWDSAQVINAASPVQYERYHPTIESETASFADLQAINPDVFGWLTVYGTSIDYPVVQGQDNLRYINTDARGRHALSGAIFLDARSSPNFADFSSILHGHHMENQVMFGEIGLFSDRHYFEARRYGMLYFDGQEHGLEFFAFAHADAYDRQVYRVGITKPEEQQAYLDLLLEMAVHIRTDVLVSVEDRIVLLNTCSSDSTNGRDILIGRITAEAHGNPFPAEEVRGLQAIPIIDVLPGLWAQIGLWGQISTAVLALLILLAVILLYTKRRHAPREVRYEIRWQRR
ncbi:MAG: class B sortase [Oscillospiraceae bacterium]|nr:class B sortase [Oscillospiraceae bacterium]